MATALERISIEEKMIEKAADYFKEHLRPIRVLSADQNVYEVACRILNKRPTPSPLTIQTARGRDLWKKISMGTSENEFRTLIQAIRQSTSPQIIALAQQKLPGLV